MSATELPLIVFTLRVLVPEARRAEVLHTLRSLVGPTSAKPGCLSCHLYADVIDERALTWTEEWKSRESLDAHVRSHEYRNLLEVMDIAAQAPDVRFDTVTGSAGLELIEAARVTH